MQLCVVQRTLTGCARCACLPGRSRGTGGTGADMVEACSRCLAAFRAYPMPRVPPSMRHLILTLWHARTSRYSGEWAHDAAHGKGTLVMPSGLSYSGVWAAGVFEGRGDCRYSDSSTYQGTFKAGLRDGRGTLTFPNGAVYNGRFREDRLEGSGTLSLTKPVPAEDGTDTLLVPVSLQADLQLVHLRAGFTSKGL